VMWSPDNSSSKRIVPPPPQSATVADVLPSLAPPNREPDLADLQISATVSVAETPDIPPSTTAPLVIRGPELVKQLPETAAKPVEQPTPARVVSVSHVQVRGPVEIPLANASFQALASEQQTLGRAGKTLGEGSDDFPDKEREDTFATVPPVDQDNPNVGPGKTSPPGSQSASEPGTGPDGKPSVDRITLPKNGQFGVVVVGSSLAEEYPETVEIWHSRLVYTVYLHVGLVKSWILQYSVPHPEDDAELGSITRPEAPWPYEIDRPHLAAGDYNSDSIIVHGFVNLAGRFEHLAIVFPPNFAQAEFLLTTLRRWQFRPALQNKKLAAVEILLIIPEEVQ
jgi:hypothetical protein